MKECSKCGEVKHLERFCKDRKSKDGYQSQCKDCKAKWIAENNPPSKGTFRKTKEAQLQGYYRNRVHQNVSRMIRSGLNGIAKSASTFELLGYSLHELKEHLEAQFEEGMTWENYGEWHIDHIQPRASLPYETTEDENFHKLWRLENLQPLWAIDNLRKGDRLQ